ncbi:MAG: diacylglycerol kinase family lipid kinase [Desulfobacteraceae bacterium]|nr:diacylglycerol kinase family lipid kinase [Desulfobacteraceae bacterium]
MKFLIIANPVSGGKKGKKQLPKIEKLLKNHNINYDLKTTLYHGHAEQIIKGADLDQYNGVALIGGDGTNFHVLNGLIKNHDKNLPPVAIIPAGSGDSFALDLGIKNDLDGIKAIAENNTKPVDVLSFTSENNVYYCINLVGMGFVTEVSKVSEKFKFLKDLSYIIGVVYKTLFLKFYKIELIVNNKTISGEKCFIEFCNSKYTGGKMLMAPKAEIDDGYFDIIIASKISRFTLLKAFPKIFTGTHIKMDEITTIRTKKALLTTEKPESLNPDGEIFGKTPTEISIFPKKINYFYLK